MSLHWEDCHGCTSGDWAVGCELCYWRATAEANEAEIARLNARHQKHLRLIRTMSSESVSPEEATELRGQIAALIAEVGTLRSRPTEIQS